MEFKEIMASLKKKEYKPVYFLMGEEPYFIDAVSDYIEKNVLDETEKEFNQTVLYGRDVDLLTVLSNAKRFPMMSDRQVVIVKEAQNIRGLIGKDEEGGAATDKAKHPFLTYLENPQKSTILVICYKYKTVDKRTSIAKQLNKYAVVLESKKLYDNEVAGWITAFVKSKNYNISPPAAALLAEYLGNDISKVVNEIEKLAILLPAQTEINTDHIQKNIGISKEYNIFELQKALGTKNILKANQIVNYFAANPKDNPLVVTITSLYSYFNKILTYHFLTDKSTAAAALGVNPYFLKDYQQASALYPALKIKTIVSDLRTYDLKSKGVGNGSADNGELLKELIFKILH